MERGSHSPGLRPRPNGYLLSSTDRHSQLSDGPQTSRPQIISSSAQYRNTRSNRKAEQGPHYEFNIACYDTARTTNPSPFRDSRCEWEWSHNSLMTIQPDSEKSPAQLSQKYIGYTPSLHIGEHTVSPWLLYNSRRHARTTYRELSQVNSSQGLRSGLARPPMGQHQANAYNSTRQNSMAYGELQTLELGKPLSADKIKRRHGHRFMCGKILVQLMIPKMTLSISCIMEETQVHMAIGNNDVGFLAQGESKDTKIARKPLGPERVCVPVTLQKQVITRREGLEDLEQLRTPTAGNSSKAYHSYQQNQEHGRQAFFHNIHQSRLELSVHYHKIHERHSVLDALAADWTVPQQSFVSFPNVKGYSDIHDFPLAMITNELCNIRSLQAAWETKVRHIIDTHRKTVNLIRMLQRQQRTVFSGVASRHAKRFRKGQDSGG